ncbi:MAG TPA: aldehyde dehydrogenase family protein [Candidatus Polarisedimenticolia bacterium]|nr:aldehyde dehydrogenase family protein [Candidatus Polarisedimenticolia bacterium]
MWIGGEWTQSATRRSFEIDNPATEQVIGEVPRADARDADRAVQAAAEAFRKWRITPGLERANLMHQFATALREKHHAIAKQMTLEGGKPLIENIDEIEWCAGVFDYYGEIARDQAGKVLSPVFPHQVNFVRKEPYGVVVCIVPWNYPLLLMSWKVAAALAAGNTIVLKPSEETPLSTLMLAEDFAKFGDGVVNIVTGYGAEVGEPLVVHKDTALVAFTGSIATGKLIAQAAAPHLKKLNLELGGNDPFIVCDDVDIDIAARGAAWAAFLNMGQVCTSGERFYVFESVYEKFVEKFVAIAKALRLGDPMGPDIDCGPLIRESHRVQIERKIADAVAQGAKVRCGGRRPAHLKRGFFFEPTVLTNVSHKMTLMRSETFGPVAPIMPVKGIEEAVRLADDSEYGLGANIYTNNLEYAMFAMENIHAGTFWINDPLTDNDAGPFGGMRMSGIGRELGIEGLDAFREPKHVHMDYRIEAKPYWYPYRWPGSPAPKPAATVAAAKAPARGGARKKGRR